MNVLVFPLATRATLSARLAHLPSVKLHLPHTTEALEAALPDAEVMVLAAQLYTGRIAALVKSQARRLRLIQLVSAGYEELEALGVPDRIIVANAGSSWAPSVAEHALGLMLALGRRIPESLANQADRRWERALTARMRGLEGATLVIVGFGSIGHEAARRARAFGMRIIAVTRSGTADPAADRVEPASSLPAALAEADFVLISVPSSKETDGMIGRAELSACKPGAQIVNVARGSVIDTAALIEALGSGHIAGAALDVTDPEPLPPEHPLWSAPNVIISPHVAIGGAAAGMERVADTVAENLERLLSDRPVLHQVMPARHLG